MFTCTIYISTTSVSNDLYESFWSDLVHITLDWDPMMSSSMKAQKVCTSVIYWIFLKEE